MVQFATDGPDIPLEVLAAQEEGRLVLFCGAGISRGAGLPDFAGLTDRVIGHLGARDDPAIARALKNESFDRTLGMLEAPGRYPGQVRPFVREVLTATEDASLDTHRALLALSRDSDARRKLVTTNFDTLFESCESDLRVATAPTLPVPKSHKWEGVVYLHGRLDSDEESLRHLVLTSADFGVAYLLERWASRFVSELFRNYTVVFVGYSVDDPVMRYLVDAIAAESLNDSRLATPFAFASFGEDEMAAENDRWLEKGIQPILYSDANYHSALHETLEAWADVWSGGLRSKKTLVHKLADLLPEAAREDEVAQICWALEDPSGGPASELVDLPGIEIGWLPILDRHGVFSGPLGDSTVDEVQIVDWGRSTSEPPDLDLPRRWIAVWLASRILDVAVLRWAVSRGEVLHPEMQRAVLQQLTERSGVPAPIDHAWRVLTRSVPRRSGRAETAAFMRRTRIQNEPMSIALKAEILDALAPCLVVDKSMTNLALDRFESGEDGGAGDEVHRSLVRCDCELRAGDNADTVVRALRGRDDWAETLPEIALDLAFLLRRAVELRALAGDSSIGQDYSYISHPSIARSDENRFREGWTHLVDLNSEAVSTEGVEPYRVIQLVAIWAASDYPVMRRLCWHAVAAGFPQAISVFIDQALQDTRNWIWNSTIKRELYSAMGFLYPAIDSGSRSRVEAELANGPPRDLYIADLPEDQWAEIRDRAIWERGRRYIGGRSDLGGPLAARVSAIESQNPEWELLDDDEVFPRRTIAAVYDEPSYSGEELLSLENEELLARVLSEPAGREYRLRSWEEAIRSSPARCVPLVRELLADHEPEVQLVSASLRGLAAVAGEEQLQEAVIEIVEGFVDHLFESREVAGPAADLVRALARECKGANARRVAQLWERAIARAAEIPPDSVNKPVMAAINHPFGILTQGLMHLIPSASEEEADPGLFDQFKPRIAAVLATPGLVGTYGRLLVAHQATYLLHMDLVWAREHVVPMFRWSESPDAAAIWQGYLWSGSISVAVWSALRDEFLLAFRHVDEVDEYLEALCGLFTDVCLESDDPPEADDVRAALEAMGTDGRAYFSARVRRRVEWAESRAPSLWQRRVQPLLSESWPRAVGMRSDLVSSNLAEAAILADTYFSDAVATISPLIGRVEFEGNIIDGLVDHCFASREPESTLALLDALVPDETDRLRWGGVSGLLDTAVESQPDLVDTPQHRRLAQLSERFGL